MRQKILRKKAVIKCYKEKENCHLIEGKAEKSPLRRWSFDGQREAGVGRRKRSEGMVQAEVHEPGHSAGAYLGHASSPGLAQMCRLCRRLYYVEEELR